MMQFPVWFNLADYLLFDRLQEGLGASAAIRFGEHKFSYEAVAARALRVADVFQRHGLHPGERVLIALPDMPPFVWSLFGTLKAGGVVTAANPGSNDADLAYVIDYIQPRLLVTTPSVAERLAVVLGRPHSPTVLLAAHSETSGDPLGRVEGDERCLETAIANADPHPQVPSTWRDSPAIWLLTGGRAGTLRAAMHSHRGVAHSIEAYAKGAIGYRADDICVSVSRLFFSYAIGCNLMGPFSVGACTALMAEKPTPERIAWAVEHYRATVLSNVPTMMARLLATDDPQRSLASSALRLCISAGEALPSSLVERWRARYGVPVYDGLGSADLFLIYLTNRPGDVTTGSLGKPVSGYELALLPVDAESPGVAPVPAGEIGNLWVKGESMAQGYWLDRDASWKTFHGPWCRTDDLCRVDDEGHYWYCGRADEEIRVSGQSVRPLEVENCLMSDDRVVEVVVIAVERDGLTVPQAYVRPAQTIKDRARDALADDLKARVRRHLAPHKAPRRITFVDVLPRNAIGQVDRKALARQARADMTPVPEAD